MVFQRLYGVSTSVRRIISLKIRDSAELTLRFSQNPFHSAGFAIRLFSDIPADYKSAGTKQSASTKQSAGTKLPSPYV